MYDLYEIQVETPMGAFLNIVTTAVTEGDARKNVTTLLNSIRNSTGPDKVSQLVNEATAKKIVIRSAAISSNGL